MDKIVRNLSIINFIALIASKNPFILAVSMELMILFLFTLIYG